MLGLCSDAHGNAEGLRRMLALLRRLGATELHFLGDAVGYLSDARGVLDALREQAIPSLLGNHDAMLLGRLPLDVERDRQYRIAAARHTLDASEHAWLSSLPARRELLVAGRRILLVHGGPTDPLTEYVHPDTDLTRFGEVPYDAVFMGHTHRPFVRREGRTTWVNVGSCGLPRDVGSLPCAALFDPDTGDARIVRARLDVERLIAAEGPDLAPEVAAVLRRHSPSPYGTIVDDA